MRLLIIIAMTAMILGCAHPAEREAGRPNRPRTPVVTPSPTRVPHKTKQAPRIEAVLFLPRGHAPIRMNVEVVDTPAAIRQGLMHRERLPVNSGMLFILPEKKRQSFWMKNTPLPLSIAFISDDMRVINIHRMKPLDAGPRYRSTKPCRYAVETTQGWFAAHGITAGCAVNFLSRTP